ncbi:hypothetical protein, partial [Escherichia coli]|uniref:hypothetical protein n=1 Tax=Escherichia coli TaxID=562 RepID=UPI001BAFDD5D
VSWQHHRDSEHDREESIELLRLLQLFIQKRELRKYRRRKKRGLLGRGSQNRSNQAITGG